MLLMVLKGIRDEICHAIRRYAKANNKYMKKKLQQKQSIIIPHVFTCKQLV